MKRRSSDSPAPGDLVTPCNLGSCTHIMIWSSWDNFPIMEHRFWPRIIGFFKENETAFVLAICSPTDCNVVGIQICTQHDVIGWVNEKQLRVIK